MSLHQSIERLLEKVEHATIVTVSSNGQRWTTPVYFARHGDTFYWISRHDAQHSVNVRENANAFIVIYDSSDGHASASAAYVDAHARELTDEASITAAVDIIYQRKQAPPPSADRFCEPSAQRVYVAVARAAWTKVVDTSGPSRLEERVEIALH